MNASIARLLLLAGVVTAGEVAGQQGTITGTVRLADGSPGHGIQVFVAGMALGRSAVEGGFRLVGVPAGPVTIRARFFEDNWSHGATVDTVVVAGEVLHVDLRLEATWRVHDSVVLGFKLPECGLEGIRLPGPGRAPVYPLGPTPPRYYAVHPDDVRAFDPGADWEGNYALWFVANEIPSPGHADRGDLRLAHENGEAPGLIGWSNIWLDDVLAPTGQSYDHVDFEHFPLESVPGAPGLVRLGFQRGSEDPRYTLLIPEAASDDGFWGRWEPRWSESDRVIGLATLEVGGTFCAIRSHLVTMPVPDDPEPRLRLAGADMSRLVSRDQVRWTRNARKWSRTP